jgi:hypothetical protein
VCVCVCVFVCVHTHTLAHTYTHITHSYNTRTHFDADLLMEEPLTEEAKVHEGLGFRV